jgi:iron complex transport system substrate-binding protein
MRIASLSPAATEILFALGKGTDIVCVDQFSNFPEEAQSIAHLRDHQAVKPEAVRAFRPDIVFTGTVVQRQLAADLNVAGLPVMHFDPRTIAGIEEQIRGIGTVLDCEDSADMLITRMRAELAAVRQKAKLLPRKARVYIEEWHLPPMVSGNWVPELIAIAGAQSFPIRLGELSREVTFADVQTFDPDLIVLSWCGAGTLADPQIFLKRQGWVELRAARKGRVIVLDDSLFNRPGPRVCEGARRLYAELFEMLH